MTHDRARDWCILLTAPSRTLILAETLAEEGYDVWTPACTETKRVGRMRKRKEVTTPIASGFVFARYDRLRDLVALSRSPSLGYRAWDSEKRRMVTKGHPRFTVFRYLEIYPWIADRELDTLRLEEQRGKPKAKTPAFNQGDLVKHPESGFEGMIGTVQGTKGRFALVLFPGFSIPIQIEPRQLIPG